MGIYKYLGMRNQNNNHAFRDMIFNFFLILTFLVLPTTSTKILNTFNCDELDDGRRFLKADLSIDCDSPEHKVAEIYAFLMISVFPIGIPAMYFIMLAYRKSASARGIVTTKRITA